MSTAFNLAENIAQLRKGKGLTQNDLAAYLGVTKASVSKWETGQSFPDITLLPQLANFFGISIDALMGYAPQISKQVLGQEGQRLRKLFAHGDFKDAHVACQSFVREYYACPKALVEVVSIYLNHLSEAPDEVSRAELSDEAVNLCRRVRLLDAPLSDMRASAAMEASIHLMSGHPDKAIALLDASQVVEYNEGELLAMAYSMLGSPEKSDQIRQAMTFQSQIIALNALSQMAMAPTSSPERVGELHRCALAIIDAFALDETYANTASFHASFALAFITRGDAESALSCLERLVCAVEHLDFPLTLYRPGLFDQLPAWMADQDVSFDVPRDDDLVKTSLLAGITENPAFAPLADEPRFKHIVRRLEAKLA